MFEAIKYRLWKYNIPHAIICDYFESEWQAFAALDMSQLHKISITKCGHREPQKQCKVFRVHMDQIR